MEKKLLMTMFTAMLSLSLIACGNEKTGENVSENEAVSENETASENEAVSENETVSEDQVEEEIVILPYCEEQGCKTVAQTTYNIPYLADFVNDEGTEIVDDPIYSLDTSTGCDVDLTNITVTPSEEDGYIDMVIETTASATVQLVYHPEKDEEGTGRSCYPFNYNLPGYWIADYYTGQVAPKKKTFGDGEFEYTYNVEWDGKTYPITISDSIEWTNGKWSEWAMNEDETSTSQSTVSFVKVVTVHMPKDYDGLVLYNSLKGTNAMSFASDAEKEVNTDTVYYLCQPDEDGITIAPEDLILIRVSDILPEDAVSENSVSEDAVSEN